MNRATNMGTRPHRGPAERAKMLLGELSVEQKVAQVSCYFPADINNTGLRSPVPAWCGTRLVPSGSSG